MTCGRCKGLMVEEWRPDFTPETHIWRCINCGAILDPLIKQNRLLSGQDTPLVLQTVGLVH